MENPQTAKRQKSQLSDTTQQSKSPSDNKKNKIQEKSQQKEQRKLKIPSKSDYQKVKCTNGGKAHFVCINEECSFYGFLCEAQGKCSCYQLHQKCSLATLKSIVNELASRMEAFLPVKLSVSDLIDKTIDELSIYKDKLNTEMIEKYQQICLTQDQRQFLRAIKTGQVKSICGKSTVHVVFKSQFIFKVNEIIRKTKRDMENTWNVLETQLAKFQTDFQQKLTRCTLVQEGFFYKSQIVTTFQETNRIREFFKEQKVKSAELLYRASENAFEVNRFFQKCCYTKNTITLIQTQAGKIIGGFNPFVWIKPDKDEFYNDVEGRSFIFSLSDNQKFELAKKDKAIRRNPGFGPMWGDGTDLCIANLANANTTSTASIFSSYTNDKYKQSNVIAYEKLTGAKGTPNFKVKQWEVWKLQFEE